MAIHFLTLDDIGVYFKNHITKKELKHQAIGSTITLNEDRIVVVREKRNSKLAKSYQQEP